MINKCIIISLFLTLITSCSSDTQEIPTLVVGQEFTNSEVRVISIDTFDVELTTFKFDSIITSNRILLGQYEDAYFGRIRSSSFFELNSSNFNIDDDAVIDSVGLVLGYDKYFYNDTTKLSTIEIHVLTDFLKSDDDAFYNTSNVPYSPTPTATFQYYPEPNADSLYVSLPLNFGNNIFQTIVDEIDNNEDLVQIFKGITLQPNEQDDTSVIGFSKLKEKTYIRFYYTIPSENGSDVHTFDLYINPNPISCFNKIQNTEPNSNLIALSNQEVNLISTSTNNISYFQSGTGYATRIRFPTIRDLFNITGKGTVLSAKLQLKPKKSSYTDILPIIDSLSIFVVDQNNIVSDQILHSYGQAYAKISYNNEEFDEIYYNIPVLRYIDRKLYQSPIVDDALILLPKNNNASVDRILFANTLLTEGFTTKLITAYAIYENEED